MPIVKYVREKERAKQGAGDSKQAATNRMQDAGCRVQTKAKNDFRMRLMDRLISARPESR